MRPLPNLAVALSLALLPACDACNQVEQERIAALEAELKEVREQLDELAAQRSRPATIVDHGEAPAAKGGDAAAEDYAVENTLTVTRVQVEQAAEQLEEVDDDLADLEEDVDRQLEDLEAMRADLDELTSAINNHADAIEALAEELVLQHVEAEPLLELSQVLYLQDGAVVLDGTDLIIQQGVRRQRSRKRAGTVFMGGAYRPTTPWRGSTCV